MKGLVLVFLLAATTAQAQQLECGPHDTMVADLQTKFGESRLGIGLTKQGGLMELFANIETGSWTALFTGPEKMSCIGAFGMSYQSIVPEPVGIDG